ncbi:26005_t:CDS:2 [Gigaspora margarita]|uniref:26005_t:CDS:1 n=1 Tax=Gigaspora margarita TaxID=4874 RepID=A0ABN7UQY1_GIGMA|nr:26005_t:CDS:2 [Gigaspora margarita]
MNSLMLNITIELKPERIEIEKNKNDPCLDGFKSLKVNSSETVKPKKNKRSKIGCKVRVIISANKLI